MRRGRKNDPAYNQPLEDLPQERAADLRQQSQEIQTLLGERLEILERLLSTVAEPNRSLFLAHEGQEVPLAELAQQYELSVDGVKARLRRTRADLRARLLKISAGREPI